MTAHHTRRTGPAVYAGRVSATAVAAPPPEHAEGSDPRPGHRRATAVAARLALAAGSGLLLHAAFAPRELWWLAPLAFTGLGLVLHRRRPLAAAGYGAVFGLAFNLLHLVWIQDFLGAEFGPAPWLALSAVLAAYVAAACGLMPLVARLPGAPVWMAAVFLLQEAARARWPFNGFPWGRVGFSQSDGAWLSLASVGGAPLLGLAVATTGFALAHLALRVHRTGLRTPDRSWITPAATAAVPVVAGLAVWPTVGTDAQEGTRTVALVQGNAPDVGIGLLGERDTLRANHLAESADLLDRIRAGDVPDPDLVVWPETATDTDGDDPRIDAMVDAFDTPTLVGALYRPDGATTTENAAVLWEPGQGPTAHYTKRELVPFAEYVPARDLAALFTPFLGNTRDMRWGTEPVVLDTAGTGVGSVICYEIAYDHPARDLVNSGAELLVTPTNNAWFGRGEMTHQQLAMSRVRAVEHGRAVAVAATSGVSAIVDPDGDVRTATDTYTDTSLVAEMPLRRETTLSDRLGPWTEYTLVVAAAAAVAIGGALRLRGRARHTTDTRAVDAPHASTAEGEQHGGGDTAQGGDRPGAGGRPDL